MQRCLLLSLLLSLLGVACASHISHFQKIEPFAKPAPSQPRSELIDSRTPMPMIEGPTVGTSLRTPLPVEMIDRATYLPDGWELAVPFEGTFRITNGYGYQTEGWTHRTIGNEQSANDFFALDFGMPEGTPVLAAAPGRIVTSNFRRDSYGNYIVIDHGDGVSSIYAHLASREHEVIQGEPEVWVEAGELIGHSGKTGTYSPHLHFAVHTGARRSESGADVGGNATAPEPLGGFSFLREGNELTGIRSGGD